ncbi:hypothetical protein ACRRTK_013428 [Alexandromys fortis]
MERRWGLALCESLKKAQERLLVMVQPSGWGDANILEMPDDVIKDISSQEMGLT